MTVNSNRSRTWAARTFAAVLCLGSGSHAYGQGAESKVDLRELGLEALSLDHSDLSNLPDCGNTVEILMWDLQWGPNDPFLRIVSEVRPKAPIQFLETHLVWAFSPDDTIAYGMVGVHNSDSTFERSTLDSVNRISEAGQQATEILSRLTIVTADGTRCDELRTFYPSKAQARRPSRGRTSEDVDCSQLMNMKKSFLQRMEHPYQFLQFEVFEALARPGELPSVYWIFRLGEPEPADPYLDLFWTGRFRSGSLDFLTQNQESAESRKENQMKLAVTTVTETRKYRCEEVLTIIDRLGTRR